jgi:cupin fold WbuC family metalloprotein
MARLNEINKEVYYAYDDLVKVESQDLEFLKSRIQETDLKRVRLCTHKNIEDELHEMFIVLNKETYIRPHKHIDKAESLFAIQGCADAVFFDNDGNVAEVLPLRGYSSSTPFYYRIDEPIFHTLLVRSALFVFHETTQGPFRKSNTVFPVWCPEEKDIPATREYTRELVMEVSRFRQS